MDTARFLVYAPSMNEGLLIRLYGPGWPGSRTASGHLVVESAPDLSPWAAIVTGETHRVIPRDQVEGPAWDVAVLWLSKAPGAWAATGEGRLSIVGPLAAEFLLDHTRMQLASARLQTSNLIASVPMRGKITVMVDTERHRAQLVEETRKSFDDSRGDRVCPFPFTVQNGRVTGLVRVLQPEQKAWWKVW